MTSEMTQTSVKNAVALTVQNGEQVTPLPMAEFITLALAAVGRRSENTARAYRRVWGDFLNYLASIANIDPIARQVEIEAGHGRGKAATWEYFGDTRIFAMVTPVVRDGFAATLQGTEATAQQRMNGVSTFLALAYRDGFLSDAQASKMGLSPWKERSQNITQPTGRRLTRDETRQLRAAILQAKTDGKRYRDTAIVDLMLFAGLRRDEVANLKTGDLKQDGGRWWIYVTGKGEKIRKVKIHDVLFNSIDAHCKNAGLTIGEGEQAIFTGVLKNGATTGAQIDGSAIGRIVADYGELAGLAPKTGKNALAPHDLRRTAARNAYDNGAPLQTIQVMLGHADIKTTMLYIGVGDDANGGAVDKIEY